MLPTKLPLEEFYQEYAGLWQHALDTRYKIEGRLKCYVGLFAAIATRKVTFGAMVKGMRLGISNALSKPESFLRAHRSSSTRLAEYSDIITPTQDVA